MDKELTKLYYSIGEVAELFDVAPSLLRYWQTEFPRLKPGTTRKGDRKYTKKDIAYIEKIYELVKTKGYTLDGARKALSGSKQINKATREKLILNLKSIKKELDDLSNELGDD